MSIKKQLLAILFSSSLAIPSLGQIPDANFPVENGSGIVSGPGHAYVIQAPKGWVLDTGALSQYKIFATFYESGVELNDAKVFAYSMVQEKAPGDLEAHIKADMVHSKKGSKTARALRLKDLQTSDKRRAIVYSLSGVPNQNEELMAFIDAPTVVILVSVQVRVSNERPKATKLLADLVHSIFWFTENVSIQ